MLIDAEKIDPKSKLYFHTPTAQAKELYLYPLCLGSYCYLPGYHLERDNYPGYSIMLAEYGCCNITSEGVHYEAREGQIALIGGYTPHSYQSTERFTACWIHFNGIMAERFYRAILQKRGNVITPSDTSICKKLIYTIYDSYDKNGRVSEATISKYLTDILTGLLTEEVYESVTCKKIYESIHYMNNHLHEPLTVDALSSYVFLSPYYYIRLFKSVTGNSPHAYLINLRITHAKYYLKTTDNSIKEIAYLCGFTTESSFCNTFRKKTGSSPSQYRIGT